MNRGRGLFGWVLFIACAAALFMLLNKQSAHRTTIPLGTFVTQLEHGDRIRYVDVGQDQLLGEFNSPLPVGENRRQVRDFRVPLPTGVSQDWAFTQWLLANRGSADVGVADQPNLLMNIVVPLIPWVLIFGFIWFFVFRKLRTMPPIDPNAPRPVYVVPAPPDAAVASQPPPAPFA